MKNIKEQVKRRITLSYLELILILLFVLILICISYKLGIMEGTILGRLDCLDLLKNKVMPNVLGKC